MMKRAEPLRCDLSHPQLFDYLKNCLKEGFLVGLNTGFRAGTVVLSSNEGLDVVRLLGVTTM